MFVEYARGDHLRLVKNASYWRNSLPHLDAVQVSIYSDAQSAVVALESGALDLISVGLPITDMLRLQKDPSYQVLINDNTGTSLTAMLNCTRAPTDNKAVRQALNYALDRQRIAGTIWQGLESPVALPWSPASPAYDVSKNQSYAFDLDTARSLLSQAGPANTKLDIVWVAGAPEYELLAQIYQYDLAQIGFNVTLKPTDFAAWRQSAYNVDYQGVLLVQFGLGNLNPASGTSGTTYGPQFNFAGFQDDAYTQLANQVVSETDPVEQQQLYSQLNDYYLDQSWALPVVPNPEHVAAGSNVHGLRYDSRPGLVLAEVWLS